MQYHIFEINTFKQLSYIQSEPDYRAAKQAINALRKSGDGPNGGEKPVGTTYRMMFAADPEQALRLLKEKREPRPMGEHD